MGAGRMEPVKIHSLASSCEGPFSGENEWNSNYTLQQISQKFSSYKINAIQITERPIEHVLVPQPIQKIAENPLIKLITNRNLNHWELIVTFHNINFWLICFSQKGLTNLVGLDKQKILTWYGKFSNNEITTRDIYLIRQNITIADIVAVISKIRKKKYNSLEWNCQCFIDHILNQIEL